MKNQYRVFFMFRGRDYYVDTNYPITAIQAGFWLNGNLQWDVAAKSKYFIPPAQILWVEKLEIPK